MRNSTQGVSQTGRKTAEAHKGLKSLVIRIYSSILCGLLRFTRPLCAPHGDDDNKEFKNFDNNVASTKNAKKHNNKGF